MARVDNRKLALDKALQFVETRALNIEDFLKLTDSIHQFLTNKTKKNNVKLH